MTKKIEYESLITPPEFESRCDMFVEEVKREVVPKYPNLEIQPVNLTKEDSSFSEALPEVKDIIKKTIIESGGKVAWEEVKNAETRLDWTIDVLSTFENTAAIQIWGWEGRKQKSQMLSSMGDIKEIAKKYRGRIDLEHWDDCNDLDNPDLPNAYLRFDFED